MIGEVILPKMSIWLIRPLEKNKSLLGEVILPKMSFWLSWPWEKKRNPFSGKSYYLKSSSGSAGPWERKEIMKMKKHWLS